MPQKGKVSKGDTSHSKKTKDEKKMRKRKHSDITEDSGSSLVTVLELVKEICENPNLNAQSVTGKFIHNLVKVLNKIIVEYPSYRTKIEEIISYLLYIQHGRNSNSSKKDKFIQINEQSSNIFCLSTYSVEYTDNRLNKLKEIYDLDKTIQSLMNKKMKLYSQILKPSQGDTIVLSDGEESINNNPKDTFLKCKDISSLMEPIEWMKTEKVSSENFSVDTIQEALHEVKCENNDWHAPDTPDPCTSSNIDGEMEMKDSGSSSSEISEADVSNPLSNSSSSESISPEYAQTEGNCVQNLVSHCFNPSLSNITNMKVYKKHCVCGCTDGCLRIYNISTGKLVDTVESHQTSITGLIIWYDKIITSSSSGDIISYNMTRRTKRKIELLNQITSFIEFHGVMFIGTVTGHMLRYNIRSYTQLGKSVQVACTPVIDLKVAYEGSRNIVFISIEGKPVSIRDAETGSLLWTFKSLKRANIVEIFGKGNNYYCAGSEQFFYMISLKAGEETVVVNEDHKSSYMIATKYFLYLGTVDGYLLVYNLQGHLYRKFKVCQEAIISMVTYRNKVILTTPGGNIMALLLPDDCYEETHNDD